MGKIKGFGMPPSFIHKGLTTMINRFSNSENMDFPWLKIFVEQP